MQIFGIAEGRTSLWFCPVTGIQYCSRAEWSRKCSWMPAQFSGTK